MFEKARIKLTAWYLAIIMAISLSFSVAIFIGVNRELVRIDALQEQRQMRVDTIRTFLTQGGFPIPPELQPLDAETVEAARVRIISVLGLINLSILVLSGLGGYFLAGQTLEPISEMVEEQKEFVDNASHELRTPLTSLKTEIEVALRDKKLSTKDARELMKSNLEDVNAMQKLSNYLLELNRYENKQSSIELANIDLGDITTKVVEKIKPLAAKSGIKISEKIANPTVKGNFASVSELETILIENAIKYSGKSKKIEVTVKRNGELSVKDFGIGIAKEEIPHIFERFYRAETSRSKEKTDGYELGLSIAKSIAEKLGANIRVQSIIGKGSTFSVQFQTA